MQVNAAVPRGTCGETRLSSCGHRAGSPGSARIRTDTFGMVFSAGARKAAAAEIGPDLHPPSPPNRSLNLQEEGQQGHFALFLYILTKSTHMDLAVSGPQYLHDSGVQTGDTGVRQAG